MNCSLDRDFFMFSFTGRFKQESCAIAKIIARCAVYLDYSTLILFTPYVHYFARILF